jgi:siroheme synthase-like protein
MPFGYPVFLELRGRRVVVIGADAVREGKVEGVLAAGADDVLVIVPAASGAADAAPPALRDPRVRVQRRPWAPSDLDGAAVCVAASRDAAERDRIARAARDRRVLVNVMDDVPNCDFAAPAVVRRGDLALAISTGGRSPALARRLRELLGERFGPEWAEVVEVVGEVREETLLRVPDIRERARRWLAALDLDEAEALVRAGRAGELGRRLRDRVLGDAEALR